MGKGVLFERCPWFRSVYTILTVMLMSLYVYILYTQCLVLLTGCVCCLYYILYTVVVEVEIKTKDSSTNDKV